MVLDNATPSLILIQRAESSLQRAQQLNPMVQVKADSEDISKKSDEFYRDFDLVVATDCSADQLVSNFCMEHSTLSLTSRQYTITSAAI